MEIQMKSETAKHSGRGRRTTLLGILAITTALVGAPTITLADAAGPGQQVRAMDGRWAVMEGASLKTTLEGWASSAGWTLIWDNPVDYRLRASAAFNGGFEEAVGRLIDSIYQHNPEINVHLYRGNRVLHVQEQTLTSN